MEETGLVMPACSAGFCRNNAASRVEPERGKPEMKCSPVVQSKRLKFTASRPANWPPPGCQCLNCRTLGLCRSQMTYRPAGRNALV